MLCSLMKNKFAEQGANSLMPGMLGDGMKAVDRTLLILAL